MSVIISFKGNSKWYPQKGQNISEQQSSIATAGYITDSQNYKEKS